MGNNSSIQWTDATWNVARGCTKVDGDCKYCYMYRDSMDKTRYNPLDVVRTKTVFNFPLKYKETQSAVWGGRPLIFTSSLTDFFHEAIDSYRDEAWDIIRKCPHLIFQILTKRPERIKDHLPADWGEGWDNVWLGTSVGSQGAIQRVRDLVKSKAAVKFLSVEPLWERVDLSEHYFPYRLIANVPINSRTKLIDLVDWVIIGGESGNDNGLYKYRECNLDWIERIVWDCKSAGVPVFVKQLGTHLSKQLKIKDRHAGDFNDPNFPEHLKIRQFPTVK